MFLMAIFLVTFFLCVLYVIVCYMYLSIWASYLDQDTPEKEIIISEFSFLFK